MAEEFRRGMCMFWLQGYAFSFHAFCMMAPAHFEDGLMRAQISIETLLLLAVGLVALSIIFGAGQRVYELQQRQYDGFGAKSAAVKIANAIDDVCIFGQGNVRIVDAGIVGFSITGSGKGITVQYNGMSASEETRCVAEIEAGAFGKKVRVEYGGMKDEEAFAKITNAD
jgi:hypothetical protein